MIDIGRIFAVGQGGRMVSLDLATGQRLWEQNFAGISTPWIAGEWLFVVTADARLICLSRANGKVRWIRQLPAYRNVKKKKNPITWFGPVLAGNRLWLTNSDGQIVAANLHLDGVEACSDPACGLRLKLCERVVQVHAAAVHLDCARA